MPIVPAFCNYCGTIFNSGIFAGNGAQINLKGNVAGPCPNCGGMGHIPDGIFTVVSDTIKILSAPNRTIDEFNILTELIQDVQKRKISPEQLSTKISTELPELTPIGNILINNRNDLYQIIIIILMIIQMMTVYILEKKEPISIHEVNKLTQEVIEESIAKQKIKPTPIRKPEANLNSKKKIGRNEPCPCGSGKKYKKCHGKP